MIDFSFIFDHPYLRKKLLDALPTETLDGRWFPANPRSADACPARLGGSGDGCGGVCEEPFRGRDPGLGFDFDRRRRPGRSRPGSQHGGAGGVGPQPLS